MKPASERDKRLLRIFNADRGTIAALSKALREMLDVSEQMALTSRWPWGDRPPGKPRLCKTLALQMAADDPEELRRIKRARKALGLPAWWSLP